jgi:hypothetical protein
VQFRTHEIRSRIPSPCSLHCGEHGDFVNLEVVMIKLLGQRRWNFLAVISLLTTTSAAVAEPPPVATGLDRLNYNHPGLVVDLGVGLWAWPVAVSYTHLTLPTSP